MEEKQDFGFNFNLFFKRSQSGFLKLTSFFFFLEQFITSVSLCFHSEMILEK